MHYRIAGNIGGNYTHVHVFGGLLENEAKIVIGGFNIGSYAHDRPLQ